MLLTGDLAGMTGHGQLRLQTLSRLRWLGLLGQSAAIVVVHFGFGFSLPLIPAFLIIALSAALNFVLQARFPVAHRLTPSAATSLLAFDIVQLAALLYLTGGLENPFAFMFLAPVLIAATALAPRRTILLGLLATACASVLLLSHEPLPWVQDGSMRIPQLYLIGVFCAILLGLTFISVYAWRVTEEARQLSDAFAATELALAREQNLSAIDGLAAAAAHQLGTPLATIALIVNEIGRMKLEDPVLVEDVAILRQQTNRCREILAKIASLGEETASPLARQPLSHLIDEAADPYRGFGKAIVIKADSSGSEPDVPRNPGLLYGLGNIIENAVDFSITAVTIATSWTNESMTIAVQDDGPGFAQEILSRLGDPYLSRRRNGRNATAEQREDAFSHEGGLGLGLFIAKTLIERGGGALSVENVSTAGGAKVKISWPRTKVH
jgi:two-component system, sensor histidine kinase RegB